MEEIKDFVDTPSDQSGKLSEYFRIIMQYKWITIAVFVLVVGLAFLITVRAQKIYRSSSRLLLEDKQNTQYFTILSNKRTAVTNQIEILMSPQVMSKALELLKIETGKRNIKYEDLPIESSSNPVAYMLGRVSAEIKRDTDVILIHFESNSPDESMLCVNAIGDALLYVNENYAKRELRTIREFLGNTLESVFRRLRDSEEELRRYKLEQGVSILSEETRTLIDRSADLEAKLKDSQTAFFTAQSKLELLRQKLRTQDSLLTDPSSVVTTPLLEELRRNIVELRSRYEKLLARPEYDEDHKVLVDLKKEIDNSQQKLNEQLTRIVSFQDGSADPLLYREQIVNEISVAEIEANVAQSEIHSIRRALEDYDRKMTVLPDTERELARLERTYRLNERLHDMLVERYEDARIEEQAKMGNLRILQYAGLPVTPIKPNKTRNMLYGLLFGFFFGFSTAFLIHMFDTKLRTLDDMQAALRLPIVGTIPFIFVSESNIEELEVMIRNAKGEEKKQLQAAQYNMIARLITHYAPKSPISEAYRTLRTNILSKRPINGPLSILITSSGPKEGKSTTNANLAITLSQMGARVAIVDLDLRRPMIHNLFNRKKEGGSTDYIIDKNTKIEDIVKKTEIPNLWIVTSGFVPPNPSEIVASERMDLMLNELKKRFDYILIDSPPVVAVTDALIISKKTDIMALVVRAGKTDRQIVRRSKEILETVSAKVFGVIVNGIDVQKYYSGYGYYYYYYLYYYYYYQDEKGSTKKSKRKNQQHPAGSA